MTDAADEDALDLLDHGEGEVEAASEEEQAYWVLLASALEKGGDAERLAAKYRELWDPS